MDTDFREKTKKTGFVPKNINEIKIDETLTPSEKKTQYIEEVGNTNIHKVGETTVKCTYGDMKLEKILLDLISK